MRFIIPLFFIFCLPCELFSQCFSSPGNPIGGTANMGTLKKKLLRVTSFYRYSYADKYFEGNKPSDYNFYKNAYYNYIGCLIGYGLTDKFTLETESGYFINKTINFDKSYPLAEYSKQGNGLSNAVISAKYNIYKNVAKRFGFSASLGAKIPYSTKIPIINGVPQPIDVRPSTGSFGIIAQSYLVKESPLRGLRYFLINRVETNFTNPEEYKFGNTYYTSIFISKHLWFPWTKGEGIWTAIIQLRNETRGKNKQSNELVNGTGSYIFFISPQINITIKKMWNLSVMTDFPIYQYYNEIQLASKYAFTVNLTRDFIFDKQYREQQKLEEQLINKVIY